MTQKYYPIWLLTIVCIGLTSCSTSKEATDFDQFPKPVDTHDKPIEYQEAKVYHAEGLQADNMFLGARLNDFEALNGDTYRATISPENKPINISAYYCFRLKSDKARRIELQLHYTHHFHRYVPKISTDGSHWTAIDTSLLDTLLGDDVARFQLNLDTVSTYVCAQELKTSSHVADWVEEQSIHPDVSAQIIGESKLGRPLWAMNISDGALDDKPTIVAMTRQHPPEVSGHLAFESFVDELLQDNTLSNAFRKKYRVILFPLMNPDGVDLGHWRHNAGGIDLNRDWAYYRQEEPRQVADYLVKTTQSHNNDIEIGLDFHSTQADVFYTLPDHRKSSVYPFKDLWMAGLQQSIGGDYTPNDEPGDINSPITKFWFYLQFGAEGITYEVGDETPRDFIDQKARAAAQEMMQLLILRD